MVDLQHGLVGCRIARSHKFNVRMLCQYAFERGGLEPATNPPIPIGGDDGRIALAQVFRLGWLPI